MRRLLTAAGMIFAVSLAVYLGTTMSTDGMALVVGVIVGVGASIPLHLLIVAVTQRSNRPTLQPRPRHQRRERQEPTVLIIDTSDPSTPPPEYWVRELTDRGARVVVLQSGEKR